MSNKPTHKAVTPIEQKSGKTYWHRVGSAWEGEKCTTIKLNSFPLGGEFCLFKITEKLEGEGEEAQDQVQPDTE